MDIDLLPVILDDMHACHIELDSLPDMAGFLRQSIPKYAGVSPVLALADILRREQGDEIAAEFIAGELGRRPSVRGLDRFIDFSMAGSEGAARDNLLMLKNMTDQLLENKPVYACHNCGFNGKTLHWICPGCRQWNTIKPIHGVEAD